MRVENSCIMMDIDDKWEKPLVSLAKKGNRTVPEETARLLKVGVEALERGGREGRRAHTDSAAAAP
jgi:hypothetical protein